jgi:hypothetical protein
VGEVEQLAVPDDTVAVHRVVEPEEKVTEPGAAEGDTVADSVAVEP